MNKWIVLPLFSAIGAAGCISIQGDVVASGACYDAKQTGEIRHVVLFKFKETATPEQVKSVVDAFRSLPGKIAEVQDFEWGTDVSPEKLSQGFTHCFTLTFEDEGARDAYLVHPEHKAFGRMLGPYLDKVLVLDYHVVR